MTMYAKIPIHQRSRVDESPIEKEEDDGLEFNPRPTHRADCLEGGYNAARPCPYVSCQYHLYLDTTAAGSLRINFPHLEPGEMTETCALDVAQNHQGEGVTLDHIGQLINLTRERVRQIEVMFLSTMRKRGRHVNR